MGGDFLILAQMPDPQPAWAQQYDRNMHPAWSRGFEPPAITTMESQQAMDSLMHLYERTGKARYLTPIPWALRYLRSLELEPGVLARFYEMETDKPLYFTKDYKLTYDRGEMPHHYSFVFEHRLDEVEAEYRRVLNTPWERLGDEPQLEVTPEMLQQVREVIDGLDDRGAWIEPGRLKSLGDKDPSDGIIQSPTFIRNVGILCDFLEATE